MGLELIKTFAALIGIIGMILLLAWIFRRLGLSRGSFDKGAPGWKVIGVKVLAPGKQIFVVEVGSRTLLIGATDKMMTPLMEIADEKEREIIGKAISGNTGQLPSFKDFLKRAQS